MRHRLLRLLTAVSLALCLVVLVFWLRAKRTTDVFMVAGPWGRCLLITSHEDRWLSVSGVSGWTDRGLGWWSGVTNWGAVPPLRRSGAQRTGPFLFWQRHTSSKTAAVWFVHGDIAVPADDGGRLPAYGDGYARADACDAWRGVKPNQPGWLFISGWEVRFPHMFVVAVAAVLPIIVIPVWLMRLTRRKWREEEGLCVGCGYDVRASAQRCPECGLAIAARAGAKVTGTAPAATAP